jgi:O-antigen/teichoic acid export membrane protein
MASSFVSVVGGDAYVHVLRFAGNLILTRLLFPEAFGLMLVVGLVTTGMGMISDVGIQQSVIIRSRERDDRFLHTAWTMKVVRGMFIAAGCALLAVPLARLYDMPDLVGLLLISSIAPIISGFESPQVMLHQRDVRMGRVIALTAISRTLSLGITIALVWANPVVWMLALNGLLDALIRTSLSYLMFPAALPRLAWDRPAAGEIFRFGRWIFVGTLFTYLGTQADRLIVSQWMDPAMLGVYGIASAIPLMIKSQLKSIGGKLLFPAYRELLERPGDEFRSRVRKLRAVMLGLSIVPILLCAIGGSRMVDLLYDDRYASAGWIMQILSAGTVFSALNLSAGPLLMAHGRSRRAMVLQISRVTVAITAMVIGGTVWGIQGLIFAIASTDAINQPLNYLATREFNVRDWRLDICFVALMATLIGAGWHALGFSVAMP